MRAEGARFSGACEKQVFDTFGHPKFSHPLPTKFLDTQSM